MIAPSSRKLWFSETIHFLKSTQTALESSKIDIFQNDQNRSLDMSQGVSVNLNHLKGWKFQIYKQSSTFIKSESIQIPSIWNKKLNELAFGFSMCIE